MIVGIGADIVDIRRIEAGLERFGERFLNRLFAAEERDGAARARNRAAFLAKRFAAKEAFAKAVGTGIDKGVAWRDIAVINDAAGRPVLNLSGGARACVDSLLPSGCAGRIDLSLSDEPPMALAFVVISAVPRP